MRKIILLAMIAVLGILVVIGCAQQKQEDLTGQGSDVSQKSDVSSDSSGDSSDASDEKSNQEIKEFRITAKQFAFEPSTIEVNKGDKVRLIVTSTDVPHGIAIKEYGINERLEPNKPKKIEFTADKQGTFTSFCSVFCGSGHSGMKGMLIVR